MTDQCRLCSLSLGDGAGVYHSSESQDDGGGNESGMKYVVCHGLGGTCSDHTLSPKTTTTTTTTIIIIIIIYFI